MSTLRLYAMFRLIDVLIDQRKWDDAQKLLKKKITLAASGQSQVDGVTVIDDTLLVAKVLFEKKDFTEAPLYARRARKDLKKAGLQDSHRSEEALLLLIKICQSSGKQSDADAYQAVHRQKFPTFNMGRMTLQ